MFRAEVFRGDLVERDVLQERDDVALHVGLVVASGGVVQSLRRLQARLPG